MSQTDMTHSNSIEEVFQLVTTPNLSPEVPSIFPFYLILLDAQQKGTQQEDGEVAH